MPVDPEVLRQIDNAIRSDLQSWRDMFFHLLVWSSVLVGIGVALEGPEVIHEARNIRRFPKTEARAWVKLLGLVGWIAVVAGVAGEGVVEGALSVADGQIQTFDEILVTEAQRDSAQAIERAADANERAGKDEKDLAELQNAAMPRFVNEVRLASKMMRFTGTSVDLVALKDFECLQLARAIKDALLVKSHWKSGQYVNMAWSDPGDPVPIELSRVGIWIEAPVAPSHKSVAIAEALAAALREEGLEAQYRRPFPGGVYAATDGAVRIYISLKPFPGMPEDLRVDSEARASEAQRKQ